MNKLFPEPEPEFDVGNNKEYKIKIIKDSTVYAKKAEEYLPSIYYLVFWKGYPKEKNICKTSFAVMQL